MILSEGKLLNEDGELFHSTMTGQENSMGHSSRNFIVGFQPF